MESASLAAGIGRRPPLPSWLRVVGCVIAGSIAATFVAVLAQLLLGALLGLLPGNLDGVPGRGWPWRIDGAWAALADLGPSLAAGFAFSAAVAFYLGLTTGVRGRRWPLAPLAVAVGFIWVGSPRPGFLAVSGGLAFVAVVLAARHESQHERGRFAWSPLRVGLVAVASLGLTATSLADGQLHPLVLNVPKPNPPVQLRDGRSEELFARLENRAALPARVLGVALVGAPGLTVARAETDSERTTAPTLRELNRPLAGARIAPHGDGRVYLTLAARPCAQRGSRAHWAVSAVDVRMRVAGAVRTQRLALSPAWRVGCRP